MQICHLAALPKTSTTRWYRDTAVIPFDSGAEEPGSNPTRAEGRSKTKVPMLLLTYIICTYILTLNVKKCSLTCITTSEK
jgi:hypothetical protein